MRLKKSFAILLALLTLISVLVGIVHSATTPTVVASGAGSNSIQVRGNSFVPNRFVDIYFDTQDNDHKVARTTTDYSGSFYANFPLDGAPIGTHTIIAIQDISFMLATTTINLGTTSPPDDRLLSPINSISAYLQNSVGSKLDSINGKLDSIEEKIDDSKATQILFFNEGNYTANPAYNKGIQGTSLVADKPVLFTVALEVSLIEGGDVVEIYALSDNPNVGRTPLKFFLESNGGSAQEGSITFPATGMSIRFSADQANDFVVYWRIMIQGTPGTRISSILE